MASIGTDVLLDQTTLDVNDKSVVHIILHQPLHGCVDVLNANLLNLTGYVMLGAKVQHVLCLLDTTNGTASNPETACRSRDSMQVMCLRQEGLYHFLVGW